MRMGIRTFRRKLFLSLIIGIFIGLLFGCTRQTPTQNTITNNYTITSTVNVAGQDAHIDNTATASNENLIKPSQPTENTTKNGMWIVWVVLIILALGAGTYFYIKYKKKI